MSLSQDSQSVSESSRFQDSIPAQGSPVQKLIFQWENRCDGTEHDDERSVKIKLEPHRGDFDRRMSESSWVDSQSSDGGFEESESWPPVFRRSNTHLEANIKTRLWRETVNAMTLEEACKQAATLSLGHESSNTVGSIRAALYCDEVDKLSKQEPDARPVPEEPEVLYPEWLQHSFAMVWEYLTLSPQ